MPERELKELHARIKNLIEELQEILHDLKLLVEENNPTVPGAIVGDDDDCPW